MEDEVKQGVKREAEQSAEKGSSNKKIGKTLKADDSRPAAAAAPKQSIYKGRYTKWKKHSRLFGTSEKVKGILVTCDKSREAQSIGEMMTLLNMYAEKYLPEFKEILIKQDEVQKSDEDIKKFAESKGLELPDDEEEEEEEEKNPNEHHTKKKRFELINAACGGMYFISCVQEDVNMVDFVSSIIVDIYNRFKSKSEQRDQVVHQEDRFKDLSESVKTMMANGKDIIIPENHLNISAAGRDHIDINVKVASVAGGRRHTLVVGEDGRLFSFGVASEYQLGHGDTKHRVLPTLIDATRHLRFKKAVAGWGHSIALTVDGELYGWGWTKDGQLGMGASDSPVTLPKRIDSLVHNNIKITDIFSGSDHVVALTDSCDLLSWGCGDFGKLGHGNAQSQYTPREVASLRGQATSMVACGFGHTIMVTSDNGVYGTGWNKQGQLGVGDLMDRLTPERLQFFDSSQEFGSVTQVAAGRSHSACITDQGIAFTWGDAAKGKLGNGDPTNDANLPTFISDFESDTGRQVYNVACGFDHTIILADPILD
eukprot:gene6806-7911_t